MGTLPFLLFAFLALCTIPSGFSLQCYECTDLPGFPGVTKCDSNNVGTITCPQHYDRCLTVKFTMLHDHSEISPMTYETRNCSLSSACDPQSQHNVCTILSSFGPSDVNVNCTLACCQGDLCNMAGQKSTTKPSQAYSSTQKLTSAALKVTASFGAICLASVLTVLERFK